MGRRRPRAQRRAMSTDREKVVVAMSGGVDSSVAACLLLEQGYEVIGLFMRSGVQAPPPEPGGPGDALGRVRQGCCSVSDAADARFVAGMLGVPFYSLNFEQEFEEIIDYFAAEYERGRTPNPCVVCNTKLKFGRLYDYADAVGARYVATGHYARIETHDGRKRLCRGVDQAKDQSYVLFDLPRTGLDRVLFPIGGLAKEQVRAEAQRFGLPVSHKPDSVEICFVPDRDYARVVRARRPDAFRPGDVLDRDGNVVGRHRGVAHYTIGQRRGLGIAAGQPIYVTDVDAATNTVTVGDADALRARGLLANRANFLVDMPETFRATAKIRYLHQDAPATVERIGENAVRVTFDEPQRAVTPGQAVVFYDGEVVLGGGWIVGPSED
jgi:tRNA-specific 2-thiouridylase